MKTISLKLPEDLALRLATVACQRGQTKSAIMRQVLEEYLRDDNGVRKGSCLELAADLVGCVEGPGDLSFNKNRLRGFGK